MVNGDWFILVRSKEPRWRWLLTWGRFWTGPAYEVGFTHWRLRSIRFPVKPPDPYSVVVGAGSNLPTERRACKNRFGKMAGENGKEENGSNSLTHFSEICRTPCDRGHFLAVTLEHHGRMLRIGDLQQQKKLKKKNISRRHEDEL